MGKKLTQTVLSLALVAVLTSTAGCKLKRDGSYGGSFTDVFVGFDWLPGFDAFDCCGYEEYEYYQEDVFVIEGGSEYVTYDEYDDGFYYDDYWDDGYWDDGYWDDGYWDDGYWDDGYDDDWKRKRRDRRP